MYPSDRVQSGHLRRVRPARIQPGHEPGTRRRGRHRRPPPPACRAAVGRGRELPARGRPDQGPAASARRCAGAAVERMEPMHPEDLDTLAEYSTPKLRGDEAVISIRRPDLESNSYLSQLFALGSDRSRRLTHAWHDSDPQIHPNWSGFLRAERKAAAQLYIGSTLETAHQITDNHLGVSEFAIDDAGARASVVASLPPGRGRRDLRSPVWLLGGDTAEPLDLPSMDVSRHLWLGEDTVVLVGNALTRDELDFVGQMPGLFVHDLRTGSTRRLTDPETVAVAALRPRAVEGGL